MEVIRMDEIKGAKNKRGILARLLLKHEHVQVMNLILEPGDMVPPHEVPVDVFFYVVEGKGTIKIGKEEKVVKEREIITCPPNTKMAVIADQEEKFSILNVKTPSL